MSNKVGLIDKFRGAMVGAVVGDCLGSPVECQYWRGISKSKMDSIFENYRQEKAKDKYAYTDDTAMARQIADSLISKRTIDPANLAERFVQEYYKEPSRGYGQSVVAVFRKLKKSQCSEPFQPASEQFDGAGSYGNGAAMRVHPVGLFFHASPLPELAEKAELSAKITHTHPDAVLGAMLLSACVGLALKSSKPMEMRKELTQLAKEMSNKLGSQDESEFVEKLGAMEKLLADKEMDIETLVDHLGNDVSAIGSVPASLYSFFLVSEANACPSEDIESKFEGVLQTALLFGGDTDTICSMAGAIAGAYYGISSIPGYMTRSCEGVDNAIRQADQLYKLST